MFSADNEAPVITCPANQTFNNQPGQAHAAVVWTEPQVTDNSGQIPTITCDANSGSQFGIGETEVICRAVDSTGNQATCTFTVKIEGNANLFGKEVSYVDKQYFNSTLKTKQNKTKNKTKQTNKPSTLKVARPIHS